MSGKILTVSAILILLLSCYRSRLIYSYPGKKLSNVRAIVFLPLNTNFNFKNIQKYRFYQTSVETASENGKYLVLNVGDYNMSEGCLFKEIFVCSNLKELIKDANISPSSVLFIKTTLIEESNTVESLLQSKKDIKKGDSFAALRYRFIINGFFYNDEIPVFEHRYSFEPDVEKADLLEPLFRYYREFLKRLIMDLNSYTNCSSKGYTKIYPNYNSEIYKSADIVADCKIKNFDINKEIEVDMFYETYYPELKPALLRNIKNFSCGIVFIETDEPVFENLSLMQGDMIISFCGRVVNGMYSVRNSIITGECKTKSNKIVIFRNNERIELGFNGGQ